MPLSYDPEFAKALEPLLPKLAVIPIPKVHDIQARRDRIPAIFGSMIDAIPDAPDVSVDALTIKSYDGADITIYHIYPTETPHRPPTSAYIYAWGGGMISGCAEMFIKPVSLTASATRAQFFSVNYRIAPENPHPTPTEDVFAALKWLTQNYAEFNIDPTRIGITGESAGGGIAAGVSIMARDRQLSPPLAKQVLIYPLLDDRNLLPIPGLEELAFWKADDNMTGWTALLGDQVGTDDVSPYAAPTRVDSVKGLPPIYIDVGELDILRQENLNYIARFMKANISAEFHLYPGVPHGFEGIAPTSTATRKATENRIRAFCSI